MILNFDFNILRLKTLLVTDLLYVKKEEINSSYKYKSRYWNKWPIYENRFSRALIRRSNFMRSKFSFSWGQNYFCSWGRICSLIFDSVDQEVDTSIMRSKFLIMIRSHDQFVGCKYNHEIKIQNKALLGNFDLMINLLAASAIMRSNVFMHRWLIIRAKLLPQVQLTKF